MLRTSALTIILLLLVAAAAEPARADGIFGGADCPSTQRGCDLWAGTLGRPTAPSTSAPSPAPRSQANTATCRLPGNGAVVPCVDPDFGWLGSDGCYYRPATDFTPTPQMVANEATPGVQGGWYEWNCLGVSTGGAVRWLPTTVADAIIPPSPQGLAQRAVSRLRLPAPQIEASPSANVSELVGVPVWLWVAPGVWAPVSATAAVPGVAVTATARPVSVTWDFGPGGRTVCQGPGTPFRAGVDDPAGSSPDCGVVFSEPSTGQAGGRFPVTVTVSWSVAWAGAGQAGVFAGLTSQAVTSVTVREAQALVVAGGGGTR